MSKEKTFEAIRQAITDGTITPEELVTEFYATRLSDHFTQQSTDFVQLTLCEVTYRPLSASEAKEEKKWRPHPLRLTVDAMLTRPGARTSIFHPRYEGHYHTLEDAKNSASSWARKALDEGFRKTVDKMRRVVSGAPFAHTYEGEYLTELLHAEYNVWRDQDRSRMVLTYLIEAANAHPRDFYDKYVKHLVDLVRAQNDDSLPLFEQAVLDIADSYNSGGQGF